MIPIRKCKFESNETADIALSRIAWQTEKVQDFLGISITNPTMDTSKPWVGKVDRSRRTFEIILAAPKFKPRWLNGNFVPLFIKGHITSDQEKCKIELTFNLGVPTMLFLGFIFISPIVFAITEDIEWIGMLSGMLLPSLFVLCLILQLNRTENKIIDLLGL